MMLLYIIPCERQGVQINLEHRDSYTPTHPTGAAGKPQSERSEMQAAPEKPKSGKHHKCY